MISMKRLNKGKSTVYNVPFHWTETNHLITKKAFGRIKLRLCSEKSQRKLEATVIIILKIHKDGILTLMQK